MGELMPQMPQKDPRQDALEAIQEGRATPTPEFAASETGLKYGASKRLVPESEYAITRDIMGNKINSMNVQELDAFIKHITNLLPTVKAETNQVSKERHEASFSKANEEDWKVLREVHGMMSVTFQQLKTYLDWAQGRKESLGRETKRIS